MNITHKLKEASYSYAHLYLLKKIPTLIYAPGRVGSMGLIKDLRKAGVFSFKIESLLKQNRGTEKFVHKHIINRKKPARIITMMRDPMAMMISYYISKVNFGWLGKGLNPDDIDDVPKLQQSFIKEVLEAERLDEHLDWFDKEFEEFLGYSVFDHPFNTEQLYTQIDHEQYPLLALRTELPDETKSQVISDWLETKVVVTRSNTRNEKSNPEAYKKFKDTLSVPAPILEKIYTSKYATHFFSSEEIMALKAKWS